MAVTAPPRLSRRRNDETFADLSREWQASPDWELRYTSKTKKQHVNSLRALEEKWGRYLLEDFDRPQMYRDLRNWQDENAHRPAACDNFFNTLNSVLNFGVQQRKLEHNVAAGIGDIYTVGQRAGITWTSEEVDCFVRKADELGMPNIGDVARLADLCGFRLQDLISATEEHVFEWEIVKEGLKRSRWGNRYFAMIPRTAELDALLIDLARRPRRIGVTTLLVDEHGNEWAEHQVDIKFRKVRRACDIHHIDPATGERREKHLHDLRGTFATRLITTTTLSDEEIAEIMAWSPRWVARIRRVYVNEIVRVNALGRRLQSINIKP